MNPIEVKVWLVSIVPLVYAITRLFLIDVHSKVAVTKYDL